MILQVIADFTSDGLFVGSLWTINFNGYTLDSIHLEGVGFLESTFPKEWRFSIDSTGRLEFGSSSYMVKGVLQSSYIPTDGTI